MSSTRNPSSGNACRDGQTVSRTVRQAAQPDPPLRTCLLDSSGWELPGPFLLLLPLCKPGSFGIVKVEREGGACSPARIGSFPVVHIPKGMALPVLVMMLQGVQHLQMAMQTAAYDP